MKAVLRDFLTFVGRDPSFTQVTTSRHVLGLRVPIAVGQSDPMRVECLASALGPLGHRTVLLPNGRVLQLLKREIAP